MLADKPITDPYYANIDRIIREEGAAKVSETERIFRIARCANGAGIDYSDVRRVIADITSLSPGMTPGRNAPIAMHGSRQTPR